MTGTFVAILSPEMNLGNEVSIKMLNGKGYWGRPLGGRFQDTFRTLEI